jgi:hypothetical protein
MNGPYLTPGRGVVKLWDDNREDQPCLFMNIAAKPASAK